MIHHEERLRVHAEAHAKYSQHDSACLAGTSAYCGTPMRPVLQLALVLREGLNCVYLVHSCPCQKASLGACHACRHAAGASLARCDRPDHHSALPSGPRPATASNTLDSRLTATCCGLSAAAKHGTTPATCFHTGQI